MALNNLNVTIWCHPLRFRGLGHRHEPQFWDVNQVSQSSALCDECCVEEQLSLPSCPCYEKQLSWKFLLHAGQLCALLFSYLFAFDSYYQPPGLEWRLIMYLVMSVCLSVISFCKQDISQMLLWIFAKFITIIPDILPWTWLTFDADCIQDGWLSTTLL